jgi:hypothetical protein
LFFCLFVILSLLQIEIYILAPFGRKSKINCIHFLFQVSTPDLIREATSDLAIGEVKGGNLDTVNKFNINDQHQGVGL